MKVTSQMRSVTCRTPTFCPANTELESDLPAVVTDATAGRHRGGPVVEGIVQVTEPSVRTRGRRVDLRRHLHPQGLMGPLPIEAVDEGVKPRLLLEDIRRGRLGGFLLEGEMHPLMPPVLFGMSGLIRSIAIPSREPPHRQLAQAVERIRRRERHAIVRPDGPGQPEVSEGALEDREGVSFLGRRERVAGNQVAAGEIGDSERVAVAPVGQHELAFVVGTPERVGFVGPRERGPFRAMTSAPAAGVRPHARGAAAHTLIGPPTRRAGGERGGKRYSDCPTRTLAGATS